MRAILAAALLFAGCTAAPVSPAPDPQPEQRSFDQGRTLGTGFQGYWEINVNTTMPFTWAWEADESLDFDVHSHQGSRATHHDRAKAERRNGTLTPPAPDTYSLFFINRNPTQATVRVTLEGLWHDLSTQPS